MRERERERRVTEGEIKRRGKTERRRNWPRRSRPSRVASRPSTTLRSRCFLAAGDPSGFSPFSRVVHSSAIRTQRTFPLAVSRRPRPHDADRSRSFPRGCAETRGVSRAERRRRECKNTRSEDPARDKQARLLRQRRPAVLRRFRISSTRRVYDVPDWRTARHVTRTRIRLQLQSGDSARRNARDSRECGPQFGEGCSRFPVRQF